MCSSRLPDPGLLISPPGRVAISVTDWLLKMLQQGLNCSGNIDRGKLLPVYGHNLGKWCLKTNSLDNPEQRETVGKSRRRRQKRCLTTIYFHVQFAVLASPNQSKSPFGDANDFPIKPYPVYGRNLGKWLLASNLYQMILGATCNRRKFKHVVCRRRCDFHIN